MKQPCRAASVPVLSFLLISLLSAPALKASAREPDSSQLRHLFNNPPPEYSTGPLWVWNDLMTEEEVRNTLRELAAQKVKQVWVHPRPGLMTPYLSKDWFRLWKAALNEATRLDMRVWIYDENSYPSGFAGGYVPEVMPESRGRGLSFKESRSAPRWSPEILGVYRLEGNEFQNLTSRIRAGTPLPDGPFLIAYEQRAGNSPWHGNRCYVNLLSPGVTQKFLDLTLEPYRREIGNEFGKRVPGVFTDEPNIHPAGDLPWSEVLADAFRKRWGYDLTDVLPSLAKPVGDWRKVRHNYFQVLNEQFIENWAKPYHDYCAEHHLEWTGHYWDHEWPHCVGVPDNMAMYAWHQRPAIDCLMNQYAEHTHAQFGNVRMVRELASVANQLGIKRTLCEAYGAGGWDLRFEDMKRIGDWLEVLGVNTLDQHLSYVTIRGARKRDHPQSFSYHEPWWPAYHVSAQYFARLSAALSQGEVVNRVLVLEPTTTAWMYQGDEARLKDIGDSFFNLLMELEKAQVEYDIGSEDLLARYGSAENSQLKVGRRSYKLVLLPPFTENLNARTRALLEGVQVHNFGKSPERVDGSLAGSDSRTHWREGLPNPGAPLQTVVRDLCQLGSSTGFSIVRDETDRGLLFHQRRELADGELLFLVNTSIENPSGGKINTRFSGVEQWDLYTGKITPYSSSPTSIGTEARFDLPPSGSLLLFLGKTRTDAPQTVATRSETIHPEGPTVANRLEPNVLTLDYVDVRAGGESRTNVYCYEANQFAWKRNGMERDPWDSAVQFKDEFISRKFPAQSGFEADYRFTVADAVPPNLEIVIERADLYSISCNGIPVKAQKGAWWLDKAFSRVPLSALARTGENVVTIKAAPFTMLHELEPAYVRGDFSLKPIAKGFAIVRDAGLKLVSTTPAEAQTEAKVASVRSQIGWSTQGCPFYSGAVNYRERFEISVRNGKETVKLGSWRGSVARVTVNGKDAGYIDAPPWECDVTPWTREGENQIDVTVVGTLKNTLGPHHGSPPLGAAWPASFHQAPASGPPLGAKYDTVEYGLFEPFLIRHTF